MRSTTTQRGRSGAQWPRRLLALALKHPGSVLSGAVFSMALAAVSVNALTLQNAPHPAPLFSGAGAPERAAEQSAPPLAAPGLASQSSRSADPASHESVSRPVQSAPDLVPPATPPSRETTNAAPTAPRSIGDLLAAPVPPMRPDASDSDTASRDERGSIASLLAGDDGPTRTGSTSPVAPDDSVANAQRALEEIGYGPLTADGLYGPMTREAIERFESDHGLTVTGKLVPATAQALASESGIAID